MAECIKPRERERDSALEAFLSSLSLADLGLNTFHFNFVLLPPPFLPSPSNFLSLLPETSLHLCCWFIARQFLYPHPFPTAIAIMASKIVGAAINSTSNMITDHHFYPLEVEVKNYLPNKWGMELLLAIFSALCLGILTSTRVIINRIHPNLPKTEKAAICWFVICKFLIRRAGMSYHVLWQSNWHQFKTNWVFLQPEQFISSSRVRTTATTQLLPETDAPIGYFSLNHFQMGPAQDLFGQLWKEYALSDSRYLTSDPFTLCMETVTAVRNISSRTLQTFNANSVQSASLPGDQSASLSHTSSQTIILCATLSKSSSAWVKYTG